MSTAETRTDAPAPDVSTQRWPYCAPVAAFRNALKPLPDQPVVQEHGKDLQIVQGYAEAVVSASGIAGGRDHPNLLQYLCRDPAQPASFSLEQFAGGDYYCNGAAVIAQVPVPPPNGVNCFWIDDGGAMRLSWMTGQSQWYGRTNPPVPVSVPNKYRPADWNRYLGHLHVAYTPAIAGGGGLNPVVYAAQNNESLITVKWDGRQWTTTVYGGLGGGLSYNDLTVVPTSEQSFQLIANVDGHSDLGLWTGSFGSSGSLSRVSGAFSGNPSGSGSGVLRQIVGGAVSETDPPATNTTCAFYTDNDRNLLMWPAGQGHPRCSPVPVAGTGALLAASSLSGTGHRIVLYQVADDNSVWLDTQLMWTMNGQLPFFAPPSQITQNNALLNVEIVAPMQHPAELPAVFLVQQQGQLALYDAGDSDGRAAHTIGQTAYGADEWLGGWINLANKHSFTIDTRSYS